MQTRFKKGAKVFDIGIRPTITYGLVACFVTEVEKTRK